jgi:hypothetical protein
VEPLIVAPPPAADTSDTVLDDATCNPRPEIEALERAHQLIANSAWQRIAEYQAEIELLRAAVYEHGQKARALRALADMLPPGGEAASGLGQALLDVLKPRDTP